MSLTELLSVIAEGGKSGVVSVRADAGTALIHIQSGRIVQAFDSLRDEHFGEILLKRGKIAPGDLEQALERQREGGGAKRLGQILIELGCITAEEQHGALLEQTCEALYDVCTWTVGYFQFDAQMDPEDTGIAIPIGNVLEEVWRRAQAGERTRQEAIGGPAPTSPIRARRELTPDKLELIRLNRSFKERQDEFAAASRKKGPEAAAPAETDSEPPLLELTDAELPLVDLADSEPPLLDLADLELTNVEGDSL
jgi:hypothetical protein